MKKIYDDAEAALRDVLRDDMSIAIGGFGICGIPEHCLRAIVESNVKGLTVYSITAHVDSYGIGALMENGQIKKIVASYVGENNCFMRLHAAGKIEVEYVPQGTLCERIRAGGAGIPGFYTKVGLGTIVQEGKETKEFDGQTYLLERGITTDLAIVKAWKADHEGNLIYNKTARNSNPSVAACSRMTIVETEHLVPCGELDANNIHTPGIYVQRLFKGKAFEKRIERLTTRAA